MTKTPPEIQDLSDKIGEFIRYWGFKKIEGQIWTLIFLSPSPLSATDLVESLGVSKTSVSLSIKELLHFDVITEVGHGPRGIVLFDTAQNMGTVINNVLRGREKRLLAGVGSSARSLEDMKDSHDLKKWVSPERSSQLVEMIDGAQGMLGKISFLLSQFCPKQKVDTNG